MQSLSIVHGSVQTHPPPNHGRFQYVSWRIVSPTPHLSRSSGHLLPFLHIIIPPLLTNSKQSVLVGGHRGGQPTKAIHLYTPDHWKVVGQLSEPPIRLAVVTISDTSFLVFGGYTIVQDPRQSLLKSVELITYVL